MELGRRSQSRSRSWLGASSDEIHHTSHHLTKQRYRPESPFGWPDRRERLTVPLAVLALDIATIVCAALLALRLILSFPRTRSAQFIALIAVCSICYVVLARFEYRYWIPPPFQFEIGAAYGVLNFARNLTPGLFMMLCFTLFARQRRFPRWLLALFIAQMLLEEPGRLLVPSEWRFAHLLTQTTPTLLQTIFAGFAIYWAVENWRADLVETRRRTRALTVLVVGLNVIASSLLLRVVISPDILVNYQVHVFLVGMNLAILLFVLFQVAQAGVGEYLDPNRAPAPYSPAPPPAIPPETGAALAKLKSLLEDDHIYREAGLSLKALADRVQLPEYRLRKVIHEQLGHNNYNAFLHSYRIREACAKFQDPAMRRIPILTIALSVGYQSINTFNRAFREVLGVTPSAYRSQHGSGLGNRDGKISPETE
jgi:AraC-like DNA-binding protein